MKYIKHVGVMESWWFHGEGDGVRDRERERMVSWGYEDYFIVGQWA